MGGRLAWSEAGPEPEISELLADPIVHLVMRRDGLTEKDVRAAVHVARGYLGNRVRRAGGSPNTAA